MSEISLPTIQHLGRLSRLALTEEEQGRFAQQLSSVVSYVEQLSLVNTETIGALRGVTGLENVLAEDAIRSTNDPCNINPALLIQGAPVSEANFIVVRAVMGEEVIGA